MRPLMQVACMSGYRVYAPALCCSFGYCEFKGPSIHLIPTIILASFEERLRHTAAKRPLDQPCMLLHMNGYIFGFKKHEPFIIQ